MEFLSNHWMPILVSAVAVFFVSFLTHMVLPFHKSEFGKLPDEDATTEGLKSAQPGLYMLPFCTAETMNSPEIQERMKAGPNGLVVVWDGPVNMGKNLGLTFLFYILVGIFVAYLGNVGLAAEATKSVMFSFTGTVAFCSHALGWMPMFVWYKYGKFWPNFLDSVLYTLATGAIFAMMW